MSDISEPQDLEKAHLSAWFTLAKHFEDYLVPDVVYVTWGWLYQNVFKFLLFLLSVLEDIVLNKL